jgi:hypothetical protein
VLCLILGGTGKTFLLNTILAYVRKEKGIAVATASSGIAATLLRLGRTAHSRFRLPIPPTGNSIPLLSIQTLQIMHLILSPKAPLTAVFLDSLLTLNYTEKLSISNKDKVT